MRRCAGLRICSRLFLLSRKYQLSLLVSEAILSFFKFLVTKLSRLWIHVQRDGRSIKIEDFVCPAGAGEEAWHIERVLD